MIVLFGIPSEPPLAAAYQAVQELGTPCVLLNQRRCDDFALDLVIDPEGDLTGELRDGARVYPLSGVTGLYARPMDVAQLPELAAEPPHSPRRRRCAQFHELLMRWMELAPGRVLNRPDAMASNGSKPYQAQLIRRAGFAVPETLATSDPAAARAFHAAHPEGVIFKSLSGARSIVTSLDASRLAALDRITACPVQFQARVPGVDVRVHVIGDEVFACAVRTAAVDYRYARRSGEPASITACELPPELAARCVALSRALGLEFAGIDLKLTPDGDAVCFEVNPSPAYTFYEDLTGLPIADAVARHLSGGSCDTPTPAPAIPGVSDLRAHRAPAIAREAFAVPVG